MMIKKIVVLGGGSAGWLTAAILAAEFQGREDSMVSITVIESPDVKTIGVGEGTWPTMKATLQRIGISETEFINSCSASFKQGSKFVGWKTGAPDDSYHHPFTLPVGMGKVNLYAVWQDEAVARRSFSSTFSAQPVVADHGLGPKLHTMPEYAGVFNYGYHLDAGKFSELLKNHCVKKLNVRHVSDHVVEVNCAEDGYIESLGTRASGDVQGDFFIDCSGTSSLLIGSYYEIKLIDKKKNSFNDSAITAHVPYFDECNDIGSTTVATAQSAGWVWDIALSSRRGCGYVYSSSHITDDEAESEFRAYLASSIGDKNASQLSTGRINFCAGYREKFFHKNCVAIGMSAGFIEPLEASALALVELSANMIRDEMPFCKKGLQEVEKRFNRVFAYRWERIIDFLKLHYVFSERKGSDYWADAASADSIPDSLKYLLSVWQFRPPNVYDFMQGEELFPVASYQYILYGMGFEMAPNAVTRESDNVALGRRLLKEQEGALDKYLTNLPTNRQLLDNILKFGMQKV